MFAIKLYNSISDKGLKKLDPTQFMASTEVKNPVGILLRSHNLQEQELEDSVLCIARAGAGVNNIPVKICSQKGIVVCNTPGANANAVKELVICSLFLASRGIVQAIAKIQEYKNDPHVAKTAEKIKNEFVGPEIAGKTLGLIGLGAIGSRVANDAYALGMHVMGYDPFLTVENAINLTPNIERVLSIDRVLAESDYLSIHLPLNEQTKNFINSAQIAKMKDGVKISNFSRAEIVDNRALLQGIDLGKISCYITDFACPELMGKDKIIVIPHLGASTPEAEDNCAEMACEQLQDFLLNGNIKNSVNMPQVYMERAGKTRITIINANVPSIVEKITRILSEKQINIHEMVNKSMSDYAYNIIDTDQDVTQELIDKMMSVEGIIRVRKL